MHNDTTFSTEALDVMASVLRRLETTTLEIAENIARYESGVGEDVGVSIKPDHVRKATFVVLGDDKIQAPSLSKLAKAAANPRRPAEYWDHGDEKCPF